MPFSERTLFDFSDVETAAAWRAVDDRVMGGVSRSALQASRSGFATFAGAVSLESGGGFASVRAAVDALDLGGCGGLALRAKGDGKRYKLSLYPEPPPGAIRYQGAFYAAAGAWQTHTFLFDQFAPTFRGRRVNDAGPLDPGAVYALSLLIADGQAGPFRLDVAWLKTLRA